MRWKLIYDLRAPAQPTFEDDTEIDVAALTINDLDRLDDAQLADVADELSAATLIPTPRAMSSWTLWRNACRTVLAGTRTTTAA